MAYDAIAAGLLLGSGGVVFWAVAASLSVAVAAVWRRSLVSASLALLAALGSLTGWSVAGADTRCASVIEANGFATIRLREDAKPGRSARGFAVGSGCRVAVRIRVARGSAAAGSTIHARGAS